MLSNPLLLGFDQIERMLDHVTKSSSESYPPYNIERISDGPAGGDRLRIVLAVAGFTREQLEITVEDSQLTIRGRQDEATDQNDRVFLHRGIAARQFLRKFVLADGFEVRKADLDSGLLTIDVARPEQTHCVRRIDIGVRK